MSRSRKHGMTVTFTPKRGLRVMWTKRPSAYNRCIGEKMRSKTFTDRASVKKAFKEAVSECKLGR